MNDDMRAQLTDFAAEFMSEAESEQRLKEVFKKYMEMLGYPKEREIMNNLWNPISTLVPLQRFGVNKKKD